MVAVCSDSAGVTMGSGYALDTDKGFDGEDLQVEALRDAGLSALLSRKMSSEGASCVDIMIPTEALRDSADGTAE